jgi:hypothetical protein
MKVDDTWILFNQLREYRRVKKKSSIQKGILSFVKIVAIFPGCEYGDKAAWCVSRKADECYNDHTRDLCCEFCKGKDAFLD